MTGSHVSPRPPRWASLAASALILAYVVYFSALALHLHAAQRTHTADLGQIDLAIWNTSQGRFVQEIKGEQLSTRLSDHVEPLFWPVSLVFWLWDDVRALLVLQAVALGLGAWPVFRLAYRRLYVAWQPRSAAVAALLFVTAYLLHPALQAVHSAEFHALPLATPLILWAFWLLEERRFLAFAAAALGVAAVQEGAALLTTTLGLYALVVLMRKLPRQRAAPVILSLLVLTTGVAWFAVATFVIIPRHAALAYGLDATPYAARFGALGDSFGDVLRTLLTRPGVAASVASEPLRLAYGVKLLAPVGFLALAGPEILALGLPLFLANLLSGFPFQYSGQLHYSAPLLGFIMPAAIIGAQRTRQAIRRSVAALGSRRLWHWYRRFRFLLIWLAVWSLGSQIVWGYTPLGSQFRPSWPQITAHHRLLSRFAAQIPNDAALSTMPTLYPHFSHRQRLYEFPNLADSDYLLLDLAADSGWLLHPVELRDRVQSLLASGDWRVQDAADGYVLLHRAPGSAPADVYRLPAEFYTFSAPTAAPQHALDVLFTGPNGEQLRLEGYDVVPDGRWRTTAFRLYWRALTPLPPGVDLRITVVTPDGEEVDSTDLRPLIQPLWQPPDRWPVGDMVVADKLGWYLPKQWALSVGVAPVGAWPNPGSRWRAASARYPLFDGGTTVMLDGWQWQNSRLEPLAIDDLTSQPATFGGDGWTVQLDGVRYPARAAPGARVPVLLRWQATGPAPRDYTVFLHLRDASDANVAQDDAMPTWFNVQPTAQWQAGQAVLDQHILIIPAALKPGVYRLVAGWYYWQTLERLALVDAAGQPVDTGLVLGEIKIDATASQPPDLACALTVEACASQ